MPIRKLPNEGWTPVREAAETKMRLKGSVLEQENRLQTLTQQKQKGKKTADNNGQISRQIEQQDFLSSMVIG